MKISKVLVSEGPCDSHYIDRPFIQARHTMCGEILHPISTTHMNDKHNVTCQSCINIQAKIKIRALIDASCSLQEV